MDKKAWIKQICYLGMGIALYVVLSFAIKIPLIGHIQSDFGYIAFGAYLVLFGIIGTIVGAVGCIIESLIFSGWFPPGWFVGQIFIGVFCGFIFKKAEKMKNRKIKIAICIITAIIALFIGVGLIKTLIECYLFSIPFGVKFINNGVAFVADMPPMLLGVFVGFLLKDKRVLTETEK